MTANLYEQAPHNWDALAKAGKPSLGLMARHFTNASDMDKALGFQCAANKWLKGYNKNANMTSELRAQAWLAANQSEENMRLELRCAEPAKETKTFLVVASFENAVRLQKIAPLIGCELIEI